MNEFEEIPAEINRISGEVVDAAYKVHSQLGPGLLESVYETCLFHELTTRGLKVQRQVQLPVIYEGLSLDAALRLDLLVEDAVVVELKAADIMHPVFEAQVLTYLKLSSRRVGLLIDFNVVTIKNGIKRLVL